MNTSLFSKRRRTEQRGGLFLGLIIGLLVGLAAALAVAIYVTKVPVPFINKGLATKNSAEQDAQEAQKNKNWDPNTPLYGKSPAKATASGTVGTATSAPAATAPVTTATAAKPAPAASAPKAVAASAAASAPKPTSVDPLGDLAKAKTAAGSAQVAANAGGPDPFSYFVQAGAFRTPEDAEAQRAKVTMAGFEAKITEREQSGRTVYRVRVGPLDKKDDADRAKEKLDGAGFESAIVRVQR